MSRSLFSLVAVLSALALPACGGTSYVVQGRAPFIGADVHVAVDQEGGARLIEVEVTNLVPPSRVGDNITQYVLWIAPIGGAPVRAANIVYDAGNRSGTATATFPDAQFNVIVTAEAEGTPSTPSSNVVVEQRVDDR